MSNNYKTKCNFCKHWTGRSCMVTPNSYYCREANNEYYQYLNTKGKGQAPVKSFRSWDKNK